MTGLNEKNKLKLRQVCFILLAFVPVTKISLLPAIIAGLCEEQLWAATVINVFLDLLVILSIMALLKKHGNTPIFTVVEKSLSKPLARALYLGYGLYFLIKAVLPLLEQQDYIQNVLYEVTPSVVIFLPFFIGYGVSLTVRRYCQSCVEAPPRKSHQCQMTREEWQPMPCLPQHPLKFADPWSAMFR